MNAYKFSKRAGKIVPVIRVTHTQNGKNLLAIRKMRDNKGSLVFKVKEVGLIRSIRTKEFDIINMQLADSFDVSISNVIRKKAGEPIINPADLDGDLF